MELITGLQLADWILNWQFRRQARFWESKFHMCCFKVLESTFISVNYQYRR